MFRKERLFPNSQKKQMSETNRFNINLSSGRKQKKSVSKTKSNRMFDIASSDANKFSFNSTLRAFCTTTKNQFNINSAQNFFPPPPIKLTTPKRKITKLQTTSQNLSHQKERLSDNFEIKEPKFVNESWSVKKKVEYSAMKRYIDTFKKNRIREQYPNSNIFSEKNKKEIIQKLQKVRRDLAKEEEFDFQEKENSEKDYGKNIQEQKNKIKGNEQDNLFSKIEENFQQNRKQSPKKQTIKDQFSIKERLAKINQDKQKQIQLQVAKRKEKEREEEKLKEKERERQKEKKREFQKKKQRQKELQKQRQRQKQKQKQKQEQRLRKQKQKLAINEKFATEKNLNKKSLQIQIENRRDSRTAKELGKKEQKKPTIQNNFWTTVKEETPSFILKDTSKAQTTPTNKNKVKEVKSVKTKDYYYSDQIQQVPLQKKKVQQIHAIPSHRTINRHHDTSDNQDGEEIVNNIQYYLSLIDEIGDYPKATKQFYEKQTNGLKIKYRVIGYHMFQQFYFLRKKTINILKQKKTNLYEISKSSLRKISQQVTEIVQQLEQQNEKCKNRIKKYYNTAKEDLDERERVLSIDHQNNHHKKCLQLISFEFKEIQKLYKTALKNHQNEEGFLKRLCFLIQIYFLLKVLNGENAKQFQEVGSIKNLQNHLNKYKHLMI